MANNRLFGVSRFARVAILLAITSLLHLVTDERAAAQFANPTAVDRVSATDEFLGDSFLQQTAASESLPVQLPRESLEGEQIRVTIQFVMVDAKTRNQIYSLLDPEQMEHGQQIPAAEQGPLAASRGPWGTTSQSDARLPDHPSLRDLAESDLKPAHHFISPSHVTTAVLSEDQRARIVRLAAAEDQCDLSNAPSVILLQHKEAELNDLVQHPMVVAVRKLAEDLQPVVRVFDDGIRMQMLASLDEPQAGRPQPPINFACSFQVSELVKIETEKVYGLSEEPITLQVPLHRTTEARLARQIQPGQTLMLDPHQSRTRTISTPTTSKLPYLNRLKRSETTVETRQNLLVLMRLDIE